MKKKGGKPTVEVAGFITQLYETLVQFFHVFRSFVVPFCPEMLQFVVVTARFHYSTDIWNRKYIWLNSRIDILKYNGYQVPNLDCICSYRETNILSPCYRWWPFYWWFRCTWKRLTVTVLIETCVEVSYVLLLWAHLQVRQRCLAE